MPADDAEAHLSGLAKDLKHIQGVIPAKPELKDFQMFWMPDQVRRDQGGFFKMSSPSLGRQFG